MFQQCSGLLTDGCWVEVGVCRERNSVEGLLPVCLICNPDTWSIAEGLLSLLSLTTIGFQDDSVSFLLSCHFSRED